MHFYGCDETTTSGATTATAGAETPAETPPVVPAISETEVATLKAQAERGQKAEALLEQFNTNYRGIAAKDARTAELVDAVLSGKPYEHLLSTKPAPDQTADTGLPTLEQIRQIITEEARAQMAPLAARVADMSSGIQFRDIEAKYGAETLKQVTPAMTQMLGRDLSLARTLGAERVFKLAHHDQLAEENVRLKAELAKVQASKKASLAGGSLPLGDRVPATPDFKNIRDAFRHYAAAEGLTE